MLNSVLYITVLHCVMLDTVLYVHCVMLDTVLQCALCYVRHCAAVHCVTLNNVL